MKPNRVESAIATALAAFVPCGLFAAARPAAAQSPYRVIDRWKLTDAASPALKPAP